MIELNIERFILAKPFINKITCDSIYAYSIIEGSQQGRIFVDNLDEPKTVLFWHYCGFAYLVGETENTEFNSQLYKLLLGTFENNQRRFILFINDTKWNEMVNKMTKPDGIIHSGKRNMFYFKKEDFKFSNFNIPDGYEVVEIDACILKKLRGRIIPSFSWNIPDAFLNKGKGFCIINKKNKEIACSSFSACIANSKIDIGVETNLEYRQRGLGAVIAAHMIKYALDKGYEPDWGCDVNNIGSESIARKLGFEKLDVHCTYFK